MPSAVVLAPLPATALAAPRIVPAPAGDGLLDLLRRNLLDVAATARAAADATARERAAFEPLVVMALARIAALRAEGLGALPGRVAMFGRAHVTIDAMPIVLPREDHAVQFVDLAAVRRNERPVPRRFPLPDMRLGEPVDIYGDVTTESQGALLLYANGAARRLYPFHTGSIWHMGRATGIARSLRGGGR
jgi:hypothetical protein